MFGSETWVVTPRFRQILGDFHHKFSHCLSGMKSKRGTAGRWDYSPWDALMKVEGIKEVDTCILRRQNTTFQYIEIRPILDIEW